MKKFVKWFSIIACALIVMTAFIAIPPRKLSLSKSFPAETSYSAISDLKSWPDQKYFLNYADEFIGSQSRAESQAIKVGIDSDIASAKSREHSFIAVLLFDVAAVTLALLTLVILLIRRNSSHLVNGAILAAAHGLNASRSGQVAIKDLTARVEKTATEIRRQ